MAKLSPLAWLRIHLKLSSKQTDHESSLDFRLHSRYSINLSIYTRGFSNIFNYLPSNFVQKLFSMENTIKAGSSPKKDPGLAVWDPVSINVCWSTHMNEGIESSMSLKPLKTRFFFLFIFYFLHLFTVGRNDLVPQTLQLYRNTSYFRPVPTVSENTKYHCQKIMYTFKSWSKVGKSAWWCADNLNQHIWPSRSTPVWEPTLLEICIFWASSLYLPWYQICGCLHGTFLSNATVSICLLSLLLSCFIAMKFTGTVYLWEHKPSATFNYFWFKVRW